jgi:hypothetical protein
MPDRMNGVSYQPEGMYQFWNTHNGDAQLRIDFIPRHSSPKAYTVHQKDLTSEFVKSVVDASEHHSEGHTIEIKGIRYSTNGYAKLEYGSVFFLHKMEDKWPLDALTEEWEKRWNFSCKNGQWTDGASHPGSTEQSDSTLFNSDTTDTATARTQTGSVGSIYDGTSSIQT